MLLKLSKEKVFPNEGFLRATETRAAKRLRPSPRTREEGRIVVVDGTGDQKAA
jgi:hypothetical protein